MELTELSKRPGVEQTKKLLHTFNQFNNLLIELRKRALPDEVGAFINASVELSNAASGSEKEWKKQLRKSQSSVIKKIEKDLKLVTKNHYRNTWMVLGMAFGVPFGVIFGSTVGNMAFIGIGIPMGMAIGIGVGTMMDKKALAEGRQLDLEGEYYA